MQHTRDTAAGASKTPHGSDGALAWLVSLRDGDGHMTTATVLPGASCIVGSGLMADIVVSDPALGGRHLSLSARVDGLLAMPCEGACVEWIGDQHNEPISMQGLLLPPERAARLALGGVRLLLQPLNACDANDSCGTGEALGTDALKPVPLHASATRMRSRTAAGLATTALAIALVVLAPWQRIGAEPIAGSLHEQRLTQVQSLISRFALAPRLQARALDTSADTIAVSGRLTAADECGRFAALRAELGADRFLDQVTCLPDLAENLRNALAGTPVRVEIDGDGLALHGSANEQAAARIRSLAAQMSALASVDTSRLVPDAATAGLSETSSRLRQLVASVQTGENAHVVTTGGAYVYPGGQMAPGYELMAVQDDRIVLMAGDNVVQLEL
jgi:hypothetical protein